MALFGGWSQNFHAVMGFLWGPCKSYKLIFDNKSGFPPEKWTQTHPPSAFNNFGKNNFYLLQKIIFQKSCFLQNLVFCRNIQHCHWQDHFLFRPFHPFQAALIVLQSKGSKNGYWSGLYGHAENLRTTGQLSLLKLKWNLFNLICLFNIQHKRF